jgi:hypothetical protein
LSDWQAGDLALCVNKGVLHCDCGVELTGEDAPPAGAAREVVHVGRCDDDDPTLPDDEEWEPCEFPVLHFADGASGNAIRFRKIRPLNEAERDAALRELNTPVREPAL